VPAVTVANRIVVERNLAQRIERQDVNQSRNWLACMVAAKVWSASRSSCRSLMRFSAWPQAQETSS
jgi:hypothetical protein